MSCRVITPWSEGPDADFLATLTADFDIQLTPKSRDSVSKKVKAKRRQTRTKSTSEEAPPSGGGKLSQVTLMTERQISVSSDVSAKSEEELEMEDAAAEAVAELVSCGRKLWFEFVLCLFCWTALLLLFPLCSFHSLLVSTLPWAVSQHRHQQEDTKATLKCYALHSCVKTMFSHDKLYYIVVCRQSSAMINSLYNSIYPPEGWHAAAHVAG